ncbi:MAG: sigma-70 family RNA polymerase sigma factor [Planctomycetota bacterium]|jgi:RNA polymerase sigma factor (sigma-70 family)
MTSLLEHTAVSRNTPVRGSDENLSRDPNRTALSLLERHGCPGPAEQFDLDASDRSAWESAISTQLMDLYRTSGSAEVFNLLIEQSRTQLMRRVRSGLRYLSANLDPDEVLQDASINIYRYPKNFDGRRPGAFRAWSARIIDNAIRRQLRVHRSGPETSLVPMEILASEPDIRQRDPSRQVMDREACDKVAKAMVLFLSVYLDAYSSLSERERFVLQMVEVQNMRYAELAKILEIRPEALKMVVFRARRRIHGRIQSALGDGMRAAA